MIVVICGPGGVGKGSIVRRLVAQDPRLRLSRSWTTRSRRSGEDESAYVWADREAFLARLEAGGFLEHDEFLGNLYGTPVPASANEANEAGTSGSGSGTGAGRSGRDRPGGSEPACDDLFEINLQGAEQIRTRYSDALVLFVVAPSPAVQESRLRLRGDDENHIQRRLALADAEESRGRALADHVVVNDDLDRAVAEVAGILVGLRGSSPAHPPEPEAH